MCLSYDFVDGLLIYYRGKDFSVQESSNGPHESPSKLPPTATGTGPYSEDLYIVEMSNNVISIYGKTTSNQTRRATSPAEAVCGDYDTYQMDLRRPLSAPVHIGVEKPLSQNYRVNSDGPQSVSGKFPRIDTFATKTFVFKVFLGSHISARIPTTLTSSGCHSTAMSNVCIDY